MMIRPRNEYMKKMDISFWNNQFCVVSLLSKVFRIKIKKNVTHFWQLNLNLTQKQISKKWEFHSLNWHSNSCSYSSIFQKKQIKMYKKNKIDIRNWFFLTIAATTYVLGLIFKGKIYSKKKVFFPLSIDWFPVIVENRSSCHNFN